MYKVWPPFRARLHCCTHRFSHHPLTTQRRSPRRPAAHGGRTQRSVAHRALPRLRPALHRAEPRGCRGQLHAHRQGHGTVFLGAGGGGGLPAGLQAAGPLICLLGDLAIHTCDGGMNRYDQKAIRALSQTIHANGPKPILLAHSTESKHNPEVLPTDTYVQVYASLLPVVLGVSVACANDVSFSWPAFVTAMVSSEDSRTRPNEHASCSPLRLNPHTKQTKSALEIQPPLQTQEISPPLFPPHAD